jgi:hypothetical protein
MVSVLGLVFVTVAMVGLAWADDGHHPKKRFIVLPPDNEWVLDLTTALRWQKSPSSNPTDWTTAGTMCTGLGHGARLPEIKELISLVDYSVAYPGPVLPAGNPFVNVQQYYYWSATPVAGTTASAWRVLFFNGGVNDGIKTDPSYVWCVR